MEVKALTKVGVGAGKPYCKRSVCCFKQLRSRWGYIESCVFIDQVQQNLADTGRRKTEKQQDDVPKAAAGIQEQG